MCLDSVLIPRKLTFLPCTYRKHYLFFPTDYAISYRLFIYGPSCIQVSFWSTYFVKKSLDHEWMLDFVRYFCLHLSR